MGASITSSLLLRSLPSSLSPLFSKPSAATATAAAISAAFFLQLKSNSLISLTRRPPHRSQSLTPSASVSFSRSFSSAISASSEVGFEDEHDEIEDEDEDLEPEEAVGDELPQTGAASDSSSSAVDGSELKNIPILTVKEKKDLASYAHSLGKKLKSQLVGKSGVTSGLATSFIETLEANELLKIKVLGNCPGELEDVVRQLEESTGSVVVSKIGRTVIIYRPSITKMKAEEEKRRARKIYVRNEPDRVKSILQKKLQTPTSSNDSRRRSSSSI